MSARSANVCQIQTCNAVLIFCGLAAVGLAGSQFSQVGLDNYRDIYLRLLNWIHALTGGVGCQCIIPRSMEWFPTDKIRLPGMQHAQRADYLRKAAKSSGEISIKRMTLARKDPKKWKKLANSA